eukprot:TRINITY_DN483_c0_g1_i1.p1 TRINITY_DN483_c0_g1~~TRINITY_DN483_c0_g1_i1.p1  ORF type:complete len:814 (-),score=153.46 TRINITY_DN483_c0_g1_i1:430-2871(-)
MSLALRCSVNTSPSGIQPAVDEEDVMPQLSVLLSADDPSVFQLIEVDAPGAQICYQVTDPLSRRITFAANHKYHLVIENIAFKDSNQDDIYEPGSEVLCEYVTIRNPTTFPVPAGAVLELEGTKLELPEFPAQESVRVDCDFSFPIPPQTAPAGEECFRDVWKFTPKLSLQGHLFDHQRMLSAELAIRNPVHISSLEVKKSMYGIEQFRNYELAIVLDNISFESYGSMTDMGDVVLEFEYNSSALQFKANNSIITNWVIEDLFPGRTELRFDVRTSMDCDDYLSEDTAFKVRLLLRNKEIQVIERSVRLVPTFRRVQTDVLLITSRLTDSAEIQKWNALCGMLELSLNYWDVEYYDGLRGLEVVFNEDKEQEEKPGTFAPWIGRVRYIIYPHYKSLTAIRDYWTFEVTDFMKHYGDSLSDDYIGFENVSRPFKPGVLLIDAVPQDIEWFLFDFSVPKMAKKGIEARRLSSRSMSLRLYHEDDTDVQAASKKARKISKDLTAKDTRGYVFQPVLNLNVKKKTGMRSLGTADVYKSHITVGSNLFLCDRDVGLGDELLAEVPTQLSSSSSKLMFAVLCMLPIEHRLNLLHSAEDLCKFLRLRLPKGSVSESFSLGDVIYFSLLESLFVDRSSVYKYVSFVSAFPSSMQSEFFANVLLGSLLCVVKELHVPLLSRGKYRNRAVMRSLVNSIIYQINQLSPKAKKKAQKYVDSLPDFSEVSLSNGSGSPKRIMRQYLEYVDIRFGDLHVQENVLRHQSSLSMITTDKLATTSAKGTRTLDDFNLTCELKDSDVMRDSDNNDCLGIEAEAPEEEQMPV